jgi:hypothetical protein
MSSGRATKTALPDPTAPYVTTNHSKALHSEAISDKRWAIWDVWLDLGREALPSLAQRLTLIASLCPQGAPTQQATGFQLVPRV